MDIVTNKVLKFVHLMSTDLSHNCSITLHLKWLKPPTNRLKLNIDGSFRKATFKRVIGGEIRNSNGDWQLGFTGCCLANQPAAAELQALKSGLELVLLHKLYPIEIDIDLTDVIDLLNSSPLADETITLCRSLLKKLGNPVLRHTFRQLNMVADSLCKFGAELPPSIPVTVLQTPPPQVISLLQADRSGVLVTRLISKSSINKLASYGNVFISNLALDVATISTLLLDVGPILISSIYINTTGA
ncbi:hypothetical protein P3S68_011431 [Capsicum galapagoense]